MLKIEVIGNIGKDAVVKDVNGKQQVIFSVASSRRYKNAQGEYVDSTTWVSVFAQYERFKSVMPYLVKGRQVYMRGDLRVNAYQSNGGWQAGVSCDIDQLELIGGGKKDQQDFNGNGTQESAQKVQNAMDMMADAGFFPE